MPNYDYSQAKEEIARKLVEIGAVSAIVLADKGADYVLCKISRTFGQEPRINYTNPWRAVGLRLERTLEEAEWPQTRLWREANSELSDIGTETISNCSTISRMIAGKQKIDLLQAIAFAKAMRCPLQQFSPWIFYGNSGEAICR